MEFRILGTLEVSDGGAPVAVLPPPGEDGVLGATDPDGLLVIGLSSRLRDEGIGAVRSGIARRSQAPVLFVRRGVRPGGLAPTEEPTRFTWSLAEVLNRGAAGL